MNKKLGKKGNGLVDWYGAYLSQGGSMKKQNRELGEQEENGWIDRYTEYLSQGSNTLVSWREPHLHPETPGESFPDAVINETYWVELTTVDRNTYQRQKTRGSIPEEHTATNHTKLIAYPLDTFGGSAASDEPLYERIQRWIIKKCKKRYHAFAQREGIAANGVLLVVVITRDPFFDRDAWNALINNLCNENVLFSMRVDESHFDRIVIGADVLGCGVRFYEIAGPETLARLRDRRERKHASLRAYPRIHIKRPIIIVTAI